MADAGNFTTIDDAQIKEVYPPGVFDDMYRVRAPYRDMLRRESSFGKDAEGVMTFPARMDGMWSIGITADNAAYPTAKDEVRDKFRLRPETFSTVIQVGHKTRHAAKSGKSTFHSGGILGDRIESSAKELASYVNKVYLGSTRARLATVESDGSSTFVAAKPYVTSLLEVGMRLEAYTAHTSGSVRDSFSNHKITAIDRDTHTVTYVGASDTTDDRALVAGDSIYITGTYASSANGMLDINDDGTNAGSIQGLSRTTYPKLKSQVLNNGGILRDISQDLLISGCDRIRKYTEKRPTRIIMGRGQYRKLTETVQSDVRFRGEDRDFALGYKKNSFKLSTFDADVTFYLDDDCTPRTVHILAWDTFFLYEAAAPDWMTDLMLVPGTSNNFIAGWQKIYGSVENQGNLMPLANVRLDDLADPELGD